MFPRLPAKHSPPSSSPAHQRRIVVWIQKNALAVVPNAFASLTILHSEMLRLPFSTELTYVRSMPASRATFSCESPFS